MKKIFLLLTFLAFIVHLSSAQFDENKMRYIKKVKTYRSMRSIGFSMVGLGVIGTVAGVSVISNEVKNSNNNLPVNDHRLDMGITCVLLGVPITAGGMVLGLIGHHKVRKYMHKIEGVSLNFKYAPNQRAIGVRYIF